MDSKALYKLSYGLYIVTSKKDGKINGQISNTVFQITSGPQTVAVSINKLNLTYEYILASKVFATSILSKNADMKLIGTFGFKCGRDLDKCAEVKYEIGVTGAPLIMESTVGHIEAKVINTLDCGSHCLFIGEVVDARIISEDEPMTYAYYHEIKGGKAPKAAPTYIKEEN